MGNCVNKLRVWSAFFLCFTLVVPSPLLNALTTSSWTNAFGSEASCVVAQPGNWSPFGVPGITNIAQFDNSVLGAADIAGNFPLYAISFGIVWTPGQILFRFGPNVLVIEAGSLVFGGTTLGVSNQSFIDGVGSNQTINVTQGGSINFNSPGCTADGDDTGTVYYNVNGLGNITFDNTSTANNANFNLTGPNASLIFQGNSTANAATIINSGGDIEFAASADAGLSNIVVTDGGVVNFTGGASGDAASVILKRGVFFGGELAIGQTNTLFSLDSDQFSIVSLAGNQLTLTGNVPMTIAGSVTGTNGGLSFINADGTTRSIVHLQRNASDPNSYTGPTLVGGNTQLIGDTTSLANSVIINSNSPLPDGQVAFDQGFSGVFAGQIFSQNGMSNPAAVLITGGGQVTIPSTFGIVSGNSSVSVPVTVDNATLVGDTFSLLSPITLVDFDSTLVFAQTNSGIVFNDILSGTNGPQGTVSIQSPGKTITISDSNLVDVRLIDVGAGNFGALGDNIIGNVFLDNDTNYILSPATTTVTSNISGSGGVQLSDKTSSSTLTMLGVNSYTGGTLAGVNVVWIGNTLAIQGDVQTTDQSTVVVFNQAVGAHQPITNGVYKGSISGLGAVGVIGGQIVTFSGTNNSYSGGTTIVGSGTTLQGTTSTLQGDMVLVSSGGLIFNQSLSGDFSGNISGTGTLQVMGGGRVNLLGFNTFSDFFTPITVISGTLVGNTDSIQQDILNFDTVQFTQLVDGTYSNSITGSGNLIKAGPGKLSLVTPQTAANTYIREGELNLNTTLTGNATIEGGGILSGVGTVTGNLSVRSAGLLKPGNSIGAMNVGGNLQMDIDCQYGVQVDGAGNATETIVAGTILINGGEVDVTSADGTFLLNVPYLVLHSNTMNGLSGTFSIVQAHGFFNPEVVAANALYDSQNAYVILQPTFTNCPLNQNQQNVAAQIENLINPPADIEALLQAMVLLPCDEIAFVLDELGGEQYAGEMVLAEMVNRQFIRRLYDPLRDLISMPPCCKPYYENCFGAYEAVGQELWFEGGGTRFAIDSGHEGYGFSGNGYEVVGGVQHTFSNDWTLGLGVGYFTDEIHFKLPGKGTMHTLDIGLYTLYRPDSYYVLADVAFGASRDSLHRTIAAGDFRATPRSNTRIYQGTFYGEVGFDNVIDVPLFECVLVQPFIGIELGGTHRSEITEEQGGSLDLEIDSKSLFRCYSRLGFHANTMPSQGQMELALDLAWNYRLGDAGRTNKERFIAFDESFNIEGAPEQKSSVDGTLALIVPVGNFIKLYLEVSGQKWQRAATGSVFGGFRANW